MNIISLIFGDTTERSPQEFHFSSAKELYNQMYLLSEHSGRSPEPINLSRINFVKNVE